MDRVNFCPPPPPGGPQKKLELNVCFFWDRRYMQISMQIRSALCALSLNPSIEEVSIKRTAKAS